MSIDIEKLISTMEWADVSNLSELVLTIDGTRVTILRDRSNKSRSPEQSSPVVVIQATDAATARLPEDEPADAVTAPLAGLCHLVPEVGGAPFVSSGDSIEEGQTLCIIEAMKVMTTISAPRSGTVDAVLVSDGSSVEAGTPLVRLRQ
jgi:acetyl-CoA carboxylase biotin carboxyl carrier protein